MPRRGRSKHGQQKHPIHFTSRAGKRTSFFANPTLASRERQPYCGKLFMAATRRKHEDNKIAPEFPHSACHPSDCCLVGTCLHHPAGTCLCPQHSEIFHP